MDSTRVSEGLTDYVLYQAGPMDITSFATSLVLTAVLSMILAVVYERFGTTLLNRRQLARSFVLIAVTTMMVISVVKSSLVLSLGLVGALSIVCFRTAIKDPEELAFIFLTIALGLGFGANQTRVTTFVLDGLSTA